MDDDMGEVSGMRGKIVQCCEYGKDGSGYDYFTLHFTDGTAYTIKEGGQTGYIVAGWDD